MANKPPIEIPDDQSQGEYTAKWLKEIHQSKDWQKTWKEKAEKIVKRYRDDREVSEQQNNRFNILYANTEVLKGVLYQNTPKPVVVRRFKDKNPVASVCAKILERALEYSADEYDFDGTMGACVEDLLLPGRTTARMRYMPQTVQMDDGNGGTFDQVVYEQVQCGYVDWDMFLMSPARRWNKVRWVAFGEALTRQECISQFGEKIGKAIELTFKPKDADEKDDNVRRALVWNIWDKISKRNIIVSEGYPEAPLAQFEDPLKLENFFPCPEPMMSVFTNTSLIPVPEYMMYQDQALELDELTGRITAIIQALRRRGVYDGSITELAELANAGDNQFVAVLNYSGLREKGGLKGAFDTEDLEPYAKVLQELFNEREQVKQTIYEVTGLSDIVRGSSQASETATAQRIKAQYSNIRITPRQKQVGKFARDIFRLKAEIISEHFSVETLKLMTGVQLPTAEEKALAQQQAQMTGQPPDEDMMNSPTWEEVMGLLRNEKLRGFNIDIETDYTIAPDENADKTAATEFLTAVGQMISQVGPAVQEGYLPMGVAKQLLMFGVRKFNVSRDIEGEIEKIGNEPPPEKPDPEAQAQQAEMQKYQMEMQASQAENEAKMQLEQAKLQIQVQSDQSDIQIEQQKLQLEQMKLQQEAELERERMMLEAKTEIEIEQMKLNAQFQMKQMEMDCNKEMKAAELEKQASSEQDSHVKELQGIAETAKNSQGTEQTNALVAGLTAVIERLSAPKKVVRNGSGEVTGIVVQ